MPAHAEPTRPSDLSPSSQNLDRWLHAQAAQHTGGVSMAALHMAFEDWLIHLGHNPAQQAALARRAVQICRQLACSALQPAHPPGATACDGEIEDPRFADPAWQTWPFHVYSQAFLLTQQWWLDASTGVRGVSAHHEEVVRFTLKQLLDMVSPANFVCTNPQVLARTMQTLGANLAQGANNLAEDVQRLQAQAPPLGTSAYVVGRNVAITPGEVILRNHLIEVIQYTPSTAQVQPEPVLIVPAWIMKYYILDLSPGNSLIKYLVEQGHTVFVVSWRNPSASDRELGMDDYLDMGIMAAIEAVSQVVPGQRLHAVGYCLGGSLLSIAAAAMARDQDERLATITLLAAQTDFTEPGELALFIDDSQVSFLEDIMWDQGYLDNQQMAGTFQLMSSNSLIWSRMLKDYLMGERTPVNDLMAWNADGTRLPYRMHAEYLRRLYLHNDLACGRYLVQGRPVALGDISCPIFCLGTARDHVAPWRSVFKLHLLTDAELTFVLTSGGHNVGIVNPPGVPHRSYQALTRAHDDPHIDPETWLAAAPAHEGSWWPCWAAWLQARSGAPSAPPAMGSKPLCAAPGTYVHQT
jgi:polyhydroxyalkanoate synthase subunit PhaC